jgi:cysteinyl-tRNA synthetase
MTKNLQHVGPEERMVYDQLEVTKQAVDVALMDDFDTPSSIERLQELVKVTNKYLETESSSAASATIGSAVNISSAVLYSVGMYVTRILRSFGLIPQSLELGFPLDSSNGTGMSSIPKDQLLSPYLDAICSFREQIRIAAIENDTKKILSLADSLRDDIMPELGKLLGCNLLLLS